MAKENIKRKKKILRLRAEGWELIEIGEVFGISKQRIHQIIQEVQKDRRDRRRLAKKKII